MFIEPKTHEAAHALMGQMIETPIGSFKCSGAGRSGSEFSLSFHNTEPKNGKITVAISWSSVRGWETENEYKIRSWRAVWNKIPKNAQRLIDAVLSDELAALPIERRKAPNVCLRIAKKRLIKAGKIDFAVCGRCGGSGQYSYNPMTGSTCFGCGGSGKKLPATLDCLKVIPGKRR